MTAKEIESYYEIYLVIEMVIILMPILYVFYTIFWGPARMLKNMYGIIKDKDAYEMLDYIEKGRLSDSGKTIQIPHIEYLFVRKTGIWLMPWATYNRGAIPKTALDD